MATETQNTAQAAFADVTSRALGAWKQQFDTALQLAGGQGKPPDA